MLNRGDRAACVIRHTKERTRTVRIWTFIFIHIDPSHAVAMSLKGKQRDVTEIERSVQTEAMMKATNVPQNIRGKGVVEAVTMAVQLDGLTVVESDGKSAMRDQHVGEKNVVGRCTIEDAQSMYEQNYNTM